MKPSPELAPLWRCAHSPKPLLRGADFSPAERHALERAGLLREVAAANRTACPFCLDDERFVDVEVETRPDGSIRYFGLCPECGVVDLRREDFARYAPDYGAVAGCLSHALEMDGLPEEKTPSRLWKLGQRQFNRKTRHAWALCAADPIDRDALPPSGVVFTMGHVPPGLLPPAILTIPVEEALYWDGGVKVDRAVCEANVGDAEDGSPKTTRTKISKRSAMVTLIGRLTKILQDHIITQREVGNQSLREGTRWKLPPPPTQRELARLAETSLTSVHRAMNDPEAAMLVYLAKIAQDEEAVLTYRGKHL